MKGNPLTPDDKILIWESRLAARKSPNHSRYIHGWRGRLAALRNADAGIIFSDEDADLRNVAWSMNRPADRAGYAHNATSIEGDTINIHVQAHRIVLRRMLGRPLRSDEYGDHINFNTLDNRRENLRMLNARESSQHRRPRNKR